MFFDRKLQNVAYHMYVHTHIIIVYGNNSKTTKRQNQWVGK